MIQLLYYRGTCILADMIITILVIFEQLLCTAKLNEHDSISLHVQSYSVTVTRSYILRLMTNLVLCGHHLCNSVMNVLLGINCHQHKLQDFFSIRKIRTYIFFIIVGYLEKHPNISWTYVTQQQTTWEQPESPLTMTSHMHFKSKFQKNYRNIRSSDNRFLSTIVVYNKYPTNLNTSKITWI